MRHLAFVLLILLAVACREPEPRWPVETKSGSFLDLSAERNKRLLAEEEAVMQTLIDADSLHPWQSSASGSRFYYIYQHPEEGYLPQTDDLVTLTYSLATWSGTPIYSREDIGILRYKVDKQELFPGLRNSVKLLQEGESAVFLFPSSLGYGYHGDENRIGPNTPLRATLEILAIERETDTLALKP